MTDVFENLNKLMNSDGRGWLKPTVGRSNAWTPEQPPAPALPPGHQTIQGSYFSGQQAVHSTLIVKTALALDAADARMIFSWFFSDQPLHQSSRCQGAPANMKGYLHDYARNRLLAVTAVDEASRTIEIAKAGRVNAGNHVFH